jgi:hypothetical protein
VSEKPAVAMVGWPSGLPAIGSGSVTLSAWTYAPGVLARDALLESVDNEFPAFRDIQVGE